MEKDNAYYPSLWRTEKYSRYFAYFWEYLKWHDYRSIFASFNYMVFHTPPKESWIAHSEMGSFRIRPNTSDFQFVNFAYEFSVKQYLKSLLPQMTYFIDVGACIGEYNVWLAKAGVKCFAFEPVNYAGLEENVSINGLEDQIETFRCGIGAKEEKVSFQIMKTVTSSSHIDRTKEDGEIEINTLDNVFHSFYPEVGDTVVLKLDVEGMEGEVIDGAMSFLSRIQNLYIIYEKFPDILDPVEEKLKKLGLFKYEQIDKVNVVAKRIG